MKFILSLGSLLVIGALAPLPASFAQTPAEVEQALKDAANDKIISIASIQERYGDKALSHFAAARFDKDPKVRRAVARVTGESLESLLFLRPLPPYRLEFVF
ncbi:MAG: hypothetical protein V4671_11835, partial [Armatimonadota bacterium]